MKQSTESPEKTAGAALNARTLCEAFQITAAGRPDQIAHRRLGGGVEITWGEYADRVRTIAAGLHALGVRRGDAVAMMLVNRPEFNLVDTAALHLGAVPFSLYNMMSPEQIAYQFGNSEARVVVTEPQFLDQVLEARSARQEHLVLVQGSHVETMSLSELEHAAEPDFDFEASWRSVGPDDVATLIYTSGTTGPPKGAQLSHASLMFENRAVAAVLVTTPGGRAVSYLPSAHIADRFLSHYYNSICFGAAVTSVADPKQVGAALAEVQPTTFGAVPRIWEKLKAGLAAAGVTDAAALSEEQKAAVRAKIGLDQAEWLISGAAPIPESVLRFFLELGLPVCEVWGMSELSCLATINPPDDIHLGTVGKALPGVDLRLLDDGELLVRCPLLMKGYRADPERTTEAIDADGWLHTGDVARIDDDGYVKIVDRKKELIINAAGKNMSPANIEQKLKASSPLIGQAICIGDGRPYNIALLVLDPDTAASWASERGVEASVASLSSNSDLRTEIAKAVEDANSALSRVEQIKTFEVLDTDWEPAGDELTPTSKLKRKPIEEKYAQTIELLYTEAPGAR